MAFSNLSLAIVLVSGLITMTHICWASSLHAWKLEYLVPTNAVRLSALQPPLVWNETLAAFASSYAKERAVDCNLQHSNNPIYGENIAMSPGNLSPTEAVSLWASEKTDNVDGSKNCKDFLKCGHYTQIVWKDTKSVGCAKEKCQNGGTFITCNYYPPGNVEGQEPF